MNARDIYDSPDMWVIFDTCPTCHHRTRDYLAACRMKALKYAHPTPIVRVILPGSHLMPAIRAIMQYTSQPEQYPLIWFRGQFHTSPDQL